MEVGEPLDSYPHPHLAVDVVLLTQREGALHALVMRRREPPYRGAWVLPGGFVRLDESVDDAAARVLKQKARLAGVFLEQLYTFGATHRDPRGRVVTVAHYALVADEKLRRASQDGEDHAVARVVVEWEGLAGGRAALVDDEGSALKTGFDHALILGTAVQRLRGKIDWAPVGFELLPREFTLLQLQRVHEAVLGTRLNKDSFRRRMVASGRLAATGRKQDDVGHRPAELYRFRK